MSDPILAVADLIRLETNRLNSLAQNAANIATPGFRAEQQVIKLNEFDSILQSGTATSEKHFSQRDGALKITGNATHLALQGKGWFVLQGANEKILTRDGRFTIDANRQLVSATKQLPLLSRDGTPIEIQGPFTVQADGSIYQAKNLIAQVQIVDCPSEQLMMDANGNFHSNAAVVVDKNFTITQGALEQSNADTAADMVNLMTITRHIESMQRSLNAYDQVLNTGINQIGK